MTARTDAQQAHERVIALVLELDIDTCTNVYGSAPCTAAAGTGNECYNTFATCQDKANFTRGTVTHKFCSRGIAVPGETVRPYIAADASVTPTEIVPGKGLAMRSQTQIKMVDEPCPDHVEDPYSATRPAIAQSKFWRRLLARNNNVVGRLARVRQGYVVNPWDWSTFETQLFIVDAVRGPDRQGVVTIVLSDPLKIADRNVVPAATAGKLAVALNIAENSGTLVSAASTTAVLPSTASDVDDAYVAKEICITSGAGYGERHAITAYVGSTRTATIGTAWTVTPNSASTYQISDLQLTLGTGQGAQYSDPATSGKQEYLRIGDEVIRYSAKSGDVLSWDDGSYRAQWGTSAQNHEADDAVQLCRAWIAKRPWEVLRDIFTESGIDVAYLDLTAWQTEDANWFNSADITAIITEPEKASDLAGQLLADLAAVSWYDPAQQKVRLLANNPPLNSLPRALDDSHFIADSVDVQRLDADRLTRAALFYNLRVATANRNEARNYLAADISVDLDAEGANEFGDVRQQTSYSRWLSGVNAIFAGSVISRRITRMRNAPHRIVFKLDPRDDVAMGEVVYLSTSRLVGVAGSPAILLFYIPKRVDKGGQIEATALSTGFNKSRYCFVAPAGQPDYPGASISQKVYGYIASATTGKMSNGDDAYYVP